MKFIVRTGPVVLSELFSSAAVRVSASWLCCAFIRSFFFFFNGFLFSLHVCAWELLCDCKRFSCSMGTAGSLNLCLPLKRLDSTGHTNTPCLDGRVLMKGVSHR